MIVKTYTDLESGGDVHPENDFSYVLEVNKHKK